MSNHSQNQVRIAAANEYRSSPALQAEHTSEASYIAYRCAMARGAARIHTPAAVTIHVKNQAAPAAHASHPASAGDFSSAAAEAAFKAAEARGAVRIFGKPAPAPAPRVEPGYGADSGVNGGGFVYTGEFASKLGQTKWACQVADDTLKVALGLVRSTETRNMGRNAIEELIAKRAGVGLDVAGTARAMAMRIKGQL